MCFFSLFYFQIVCVFGYVNGKAPAASDKINYCVNKLLMASDQNNMDGRSAITHIIVDSNQFNFTNLMCCTVD